MAEHHLNINWQRLTAPLTELSDSMQRLSESVLAADASMKGFNKALEEWVAKEEAEMNWLQLSYFREMRSDGVHVDLALRAVRPLREYGPPLKSVH